MCSLCRRHPETRHWHLYNTETEARCLEKTDRQLVCAQPVDVRNPSLPGLRTSGSSQALPSWHRICSAEARRWQREQAAAPSCPCPRWGEQPEALGCRRHKSGVVLLAISWLQHAGWLLGEPARAFRAKRRPEGWAGGRSAQSRLTVLAQFVCYSVVVFFNSRSLYRDTNSSWQYWQY